MSHLANYPNQPASSERMIDALQRDAFAGYGQHFWGPTASDRRTRRNRPARLSRQASLLRLFGAWCPRRPGRRDRGAAGSGYLAALCPGNRAADDSAFQRDLPGDYGQVLLQVQLQLDLSSGVGGQARRDFYVPLRDQLGARRLNLRELPHGLTLATNAALSLPRNGITACGILERLAMSRTTMANIKQNLFFAFAYNAVGVPIAAGVLHPFIGLQFSPMIAAGAMSFSSVSVVMNALRLRRVEV